MTTDISVGAKLFKDYGNYRLQTLNIAKRKANGDFVGQYKPTTERIKLFCDMAEWCRERKIDPRLWLFLLFRMRRWTFAPQLKAAHLMSENAIPKYWTFVESDYLDGYRRYLDAQGVQKKKSTHFDPNYDLSTAAEQLKRWYVTRGLEARCVQDVLTRTYGYHPKSQVCPTCPAQAACIEVIQGHCDFDIVALRNDEITVAEAQKQAQQTGD